MLEHFLFSLVHVARDDGLLRELPRPFLAGQEFRNNAQRVATVFEYRLSDGPHQADGAAAIDEAYAILSQDFAEALCGTHKRRVGTRARSAIDADRLDIAHGVILIHRSMWRGFAAAASLSAMTPPGAER